MRLLGLLSLGFWLVLGEHFDYAVISWRLVSGTPSTQRTIEFTLLQGFETYFPNPNGGTYWTIAPYPNVGQQANWPHPDPGDGTFTVDTMPPTGAATKDETSLPVIEVDTTPGENWLLTSSTFTVTLNTAPGFSENWRFSLPDGRRHTGLQDNNGNIAYLLSGVANRFDTHSIDVYGGIPNVKFVVDKLNLFLIPINNPDNSSVFFTFSQLNESLLNTRIPSTPSNANQTTGGGNGGNFDSDDFFDKQFRLNRLTGLVSWWPSVIGTYAVQFMIEKDCASEGNGQGTCINSQTQTNCCSRTVYDVLLKVIFPDPTAPKFVAPFLGSDGTDGSGTPTGNSTAPTDPQARVVNVIEGQPYTGTITANVPNGQGVLVVSYPLPPGLNISAGASNPNNTGQTIWTINWPDPEGNDAWICFRVYNPVTNSSSTGQYCVLFKVRVVIKLVVDNLPHINTKPGIFALPSKPGFLDVIRLRIIQKNDKFYTGTFNIQHKVGLTSGGTWVNSGTKSFVNSNGDETFNITVPWDVETLPDWLHKTRVTWGPFGRWLGGTYSFNTLFHFYANSGRFVIPSNIVPNNDFTVYGKNWNTANGKTYTFSPPFLGFTTFNHSAYECNYIQTIENQDTGAIESYWVMGAPVITTVTNRNQDVSEFGIWFRSGVPQAQRGAVIPLPNINQNPGAATVTATLYGTYCINASKFHTFR